MAMPLSGIRVLDLTRIVAGPFCTQTLAELGADVLKVENPQGGDELRTIARTKLLDNGEPVAGQSSDFICVNRNKRSLAIDLRAEEGRGLVRSLAQASDVFVENYKAGDLARYGLDYESLKALNPRLIYCSITGYGQTGAMAGQPGFDSAFQALTGMMSLMGEADGDPQRLTAPVIDHATGQAAVIAILGALFHQRVNGGPGQHIDLALFDCGVSALTVRAQEYLISGVSPRRAGNRLASAAPGRLIHTADGLMVLSAFRDGDFNKLCEVIGLPHLARDERFASNDARVANEPALDAFLDPVFAQDTNAVWAERFQSAGIIGVPINSVGEALESAHARERGVTHTACRPNGQEIAYVRTPIHYSETPITANRPPPDLGEHTSEVLAEVLALTPAEISRLRATGAIAGR